MPQPTCRSLLLLLPLLTLATLPAQSGRTMRLQAPAVLGQTARFELLHPGTANGNLYAFLWSAPFAGSQPLVVPGFQVVGSARIDVPSALTFAIGGLGPQGRVGHDLVVPNASHVLGFAFDLQAIDLSPATNTLHFADDELAVRIAAQPLPDMVPIAPGTFAMGSTYAATEMPVHQVTISRPFWIGRHEVTQAEYQSLMSGNPSLFVGPTRPVEVSWNQATAYCNALNARETAAGRVPSGYRYRLPTEAEWEYCCRAGTTSVYSYGATLDCTLANAYHDNGGPGFCLPHPTEGGQTAVVGSYPPNAWGLHDMHGNVMEWCQDRWPGPIGSYPAAAVVDPLETNPLFVYRIARGGAWIFYRDAARSASRNGNLPDAWAQFFGFRVVLGPIL